MRPADADQASVAAALAEAGALGGFFGIGVGGGPGPDAGAAGASTEAGAGAGWQPALEAYRQGLRGLTEQMKEQLGVREDRVAVSTLQFGYAARLWSPVLACALVSGIVPGLDRLRVSTSLPVRLLLPAAAGWRPSGYEQLADLAYRCVVDGQLVPLAAGPHPPVAAGLLHGNAASAMIGALTVLARLRPGLGGPARVVAARLLATGLLRGTGRLTGAGLEFRRSSCCLYYRVPGGGLCGDCSLHPERCI